MIYLTPTFANTGRERESVSLKQYPVDNTGEVSHSLIAVRFVISIMQPS